MYNQQGQNWSQPPWHPRALAEAGYAPFRDMLRTILRHAGGIRIDHVLGLFRLWWVPKGLPADEGAYVYYDHEALVGILCLEAQRAGAVVIGEDLGTFEPWVREYLVARGLLGTSILWFEYAADSSPLPPEQYRQGCLASVNTHDLPPTAGYLAGEHIALRDRLGLLSRTVEQERAADEAERTKVLAMCRERGLLGPAAAADADGRCGRGAADPEPAGHRQGVPELEDPAGRPGRRCRARRGPAHPRPGPVAVPGRAGRPALALPKRGVRRRQPPMTMFQGRMTCSVPTPAAV
jgi:hypothetical protein